MKKTKIIIGAIVVGVLAWTSFSPQHVGPAYLYPDPTFTPGEAATLSLADLTRLYDGQTYSQAHRKVLGSEKTAVCAEYPKNCNFSKEIDHFYPLCAGGSNDVKNLWAQPEVNLWNDRDFGFHAKDKLETWVCFRVKSGTIDPKVAYNAITKDWVRYYLQIFPTAPLGGIETGEPVE